MLRREQSIIVKHTQWWPLKLLAFQIHGKSTSWNFPFLMLWKLGYNKNMTCSFHKVWNWYKLQCKWIRILSSTLIWKYSSMNSSACVNYMNRQYGRDRHGDAWKNDQHFECIFLKDMYVSQSHVCFRGPIGNHSGSDKVLAGVWGLGIATMLTQFNAWWRHQVETFSTLLALCAGNSPVSGEFPSQRPVTRSFGAFFDLHPNKPLSKQSRRRRLETPSLIMASL